MEILLEYLINSSRLILMVWTLSYILGTLWRNKKNKVFYVREKCTVVRFMYTIMRFSKTHWGMTKRKHTVCASHPHGRTKGNTYKTRPTPTTNQGRPKGTVTKSLIKFYKQKWLIYWDKMPHISKLVLGRLTYQN